MTDIEKVARALASADGLDFDEVCGVDAGPNNAYCGSGTCVSAHMEDHDAERARRWYMHLSRAAIAAMQPAPQEPVAWMYERDDGSRDLLLDCNGEYARNLLELGATETPLYAFPTPPAGGSDAE